MAITKHYVRKKDKSLLFVLFMLLIVADLASTLKWISMYREGSILSNSTNVCERIRENYNLTRQQARLCNKGTDTMPYVHEAARLTVNTCQHLFRFRRWNCSTIKMLPKLLPDLAGDTKERAIVNAISSAALTYTVARGCATSAISRCGCSQHTDDPPNGNFKWGGCGDNISWGSKFSRQFVEPKLKQQSSSQEMSPKDGYNYKYRETKKKVGGLNKDNNAIIFNKGLWYHIKRHNEEIGRQIVSASVTTHCKCHGVSGSCSIRTCWKGLPLKFYEVGTKLMSAYDAAIQVHPFMSPNVLSYRYRDEFILVYASRSTNYCDYDMKNGSFGTEGRECNSSASLEDHCDTMCCGRGHKSSIIEQTERCNCKYHWCCYVICETCVTKRNVYTCN